MTTTNLNVNPFYDDFDATKNFSQILFKPGYSVQARELTQIQSILKDQIAKFGNHIFQQGSIVIPGNSFYDLATPYVKLSSLSTSESNYVGQTLIGQTSGVMAVVKKVISATSTDPVTFYLSYVSGGTAVNGETPTVFANGETLQNSTAFVSAVASVSGATGTGSIAYVNTGVYYVNGSFVHVDSQSTVIDKYSSNPTCRVVFKITESIVGSDSDSTLLDPAQGSYNFAAPGADRLKIALELTTIALDAAVTDEYIELMRFDSGVLKEHSRYPKYSELEKTLARRTYDESGDYIATGLDVNVREHSRTLINGGVNYNGDSTKLVVELAPGKAYIGGHEVETLYTQRIDINKARDTAHVAQNSLTLPVAYGQYFYVYAPKGSLNIQASELVTLYSDVAGTVAIGTAKAIALDYFIGDGTWPIYKLYVNSVSLTSGNINSVTLVKNANFSATFITEYGAPVTSGAFVHDDIVTASTRIAKVAFYSNTLGKLYVYRHSASAIPNVGDRITGSISATASVLTSRTNLVINNSNGRLLTAPSTATKTLKTALGTYDLEYTAWTKLTIAQGASSVTIGSGTVVPIETGTFIALTTTGLDTSGYTLTSGTTVTRSLGAAPVGGIIIYCQVRFTDASPRIKTPTEVTETITSASVVYLGNSDAFKVSSIVSGGIELLNNYTLDSGATDFEYGLSSISIKNGITVPAGSLTIRYSYYAHSVGNFFSVDSYSGVASEEIPYYKSQTTGVSYSLRDTIDFRSSYGMSSNPIVIDSILTTSLQKYVARIDVACLDASGSLVVVSGVPSETPKVPAINTNYYPLAKFLIPAYTYQIEDVSKSNLAVYSYTMKKVESINKRLIDLEQYSLLTAAELGVINTPYVDAATGLDKFRTGYFVESMEDAYQMAETKNGFRATLNTKGIYAAVEDTPMAMSIGTVSNLVSTGGVYTLPYTQVVHAQVGVSSRTTNLNPFQVISWSGSITMNPPSDVWFETFSREQIVQNITVNVNTDYEVLVPGAVIVIPAPSPAFAPVTAIRDFGSGRNGSFGISGFGGTTRDNGSGSISRF